MKNEKIYINNKILLLKYYTFIQDILGLQIFKYFNAHL